MLDFTLTPEQIDLIQKARQFALEEVLPVAWYYDEKDDIPLPVLRKAFDAGIMNIDVPKNYGGPGLGCGSRLVLTEDLPPPARVWPRLFSTTRWAWSRLLLSKNEDARQSICRASLNDFKMICFATSEPTMGSDVAGIRCKAVADGDDLSSTAPNTGSPTADRRLRDRLCHGRSQNPARGHLRLLRGKRMAWRNHRAHHTQDGAAVLEHRGAQVRQDVRVPKDNLLAPPGKGLRSGHANLRPHAAHYRIVRCRCGALALEYAMDYAQKRKAFGMAISGYQAIQFKLAEMFQKVETARLLTLKAAWEADLGAKIATLNASIAKLIRHRGGPGGGQRGAPDLRRLWLHQNVSRRKILRDVRLLRIYEGTSEVQRVILAGHLLSNYQASMPPLEDLPLHRDFDPLDKDDPNAGKKIWRCRICGHVHYGDEAPEECPYCFFPKTAFKEID
jgi:acyl-CoA dehydrogenase